jgi:hypothetical protein
MNTNEIAVELASIGNRLERIADAVRDMGREQEGFPMERMELYRKRICLFCEEPLEPIEDDSRGCHQRCYRKLRRQVEKGIVTDSQAVAAGKCLPAEKPGRRMDAKTQKTITEIQAGPVPPQEPKAAPKKETKRR